MASTDDDIEQTLFIAREVSVYKVPPRSGAQGYRSGEWLVSDKMFSGRLRVMGKGDTCEIRIEDPNSGDLFAVCPIPYGKRATYVDAVSDSSRYYVLKIEDKASGRHAFVGMGFENRSDAFDFNEAMLRHEKQVEREHAAHSLNHNADTATTSGSSSKSEVEQEVQALYKHQGDLGLKEGQTIRVNLKKGDGKGTGLLSGAVGKPLVPLVPLAPPPGQPGRVAASSVYGPTQQSQPQSVATLAQTQQGAPIDFDSLFTSTTQQVQHLDLLGGGEQPGHGTVSQPTAPAAPQPAAACNDDWATFD